MRAAIVVLMSIVVASSALAQAPAAEPPPAAEQPPAASPSPDEGDDAAPSASEAAAGSETKPLPLPDARAEASDDDNAPLIEDVAVAASSPTTAPMITAVITDDWSGVERAHVHYRPLNAASFEKAALNPGTGGLFIARLPDGTQSTGFEYYVEVWDAAGNGPSLMGTPEQPYRVEAAAEGTVARLEREQSERDMGPVHPAWMMLSLGSGILAGAGAGIFWIDFVNLQSQLASENEPTRRAALEEAAVGDAAIASVLSVIAAAGLVTGVGLLIYSAVEE